MVRPTKSGPGTCTKRSRHLTDLLEHINKKHRGTGFTQEDLTDTRLIACSCGKVLLDERGSHHHQLRFGCPVRGSTTSRSRSRSHPRLVNNRQDRVRSTTSTLSSLSSVQSNDSNPPHYRPSARQSTVSTLSPLPATPPITPSPLRQIVLLL